MRDKVWFHTTMRLTGAATYASLFFNKNAGNPNLWNYEPDTSRDAAFNDHTIRNANVRVTWQATQKHKLAVSVDPSRICDCPRGLVATTAPEAFMMNYVTNYPKVFLFGDWTAPLTNRLLVDSAFVRHWSLTRRPEQNLLLGGAAKHDRGARAVEQPALPRLVHGAPDAERHPVLARFGVIHHRRAQPRRWASTTAGGCRIAPTSRPTRRSSTASTTACPNQLTLHARPFRNITHIRDHGLFVQDRWTVNRLTVTGGLRYDYFHDFFPETPIGPSRVRAEPEPRVPENRRRAVARPAAASRLRLRRLR